MSNILSRILNVLKYILFILAFALILLGVILTYKRLEKNLVDALNIFLPFIILFILFVINIFVKNDIKDNLLFNSTCVITFIVIIIIGLRAKFDTNMLLYYKYKVSYNPNFLSDNLSSIKIILFCLSGANLLLLIKSILQREKKVIVNNLQDSTNNSNISDNNSNNNIENNEDIVNLINNAPLNNNEIKQELIDSTEEL